MLEGVKSIQQMAVEAKEEQKTRVLLWDMQNGDDEDPNNPFCTGVGTTSSQA